MLKQLPLVNVAFPEERKALLALAEVDQRAVRTHAMKAAAMTASERSTADYQLAKECHSRAKDMLGIVRKITDLVRHNVGGDGLEAVSLLALHSHLVIMKDVLARFEAQFRKDPSSTYAQAIPPLTDRISILESRRQIYGTNWMRDQRGKPFLIPTVDFEGVNQRRRLYGLDILRRPVDLAPGAAKYPLGKGVARESDQKELTDAEYEEYSRFYLTPM